MNAPVWNFSGFEFSAAEGLRRDGRTVGLPPKARRLLQLLLRSGGALVGKEAIADALWPGQAPSDASISRVIHLLRRALGDDGEEVITTAYGEGVRLKAAATPSRASPPEEDRGAADRVLRQTAYEIASGRTGASLQRTLATLRAVGERDPGNAEARSLQAELTAGLAIRGVLSPAAAAEQIAEHTSAALKLNPDNASALAVSGWALAVLGRRPDEGRLRLDRAIELAPDHAMARYARSWQRVGARDLADALEDVEAGLDVQPLERALLAARARLTLCAGRIDEADALAEQAISLRPDVDTFLYTRVVVASLRGEPKSAVRLAQKAAQISGNERMSLAHLAYALACAGREAEARRTYAAASVGFPKSALPAPALVALGDLEGARNLLREAEESGCPWRSFVWCSPTLARL